MDPSDVINLVQRAIVLSGNAHFIFNTERRKAVIAKTMPDNMDLLSEKKAKRKLAKAKGVLFGRKFLKYLAKESKDDKHLRELLVPSFNKKNQFGKGNYNKTNQNGPQFFQNRSSNNLQYAGQRQDAQVRRGRPLQTIQHRQNRVSAQTHGNQK